MPKTLDDRHSWTRNEVLSMYEQFVQGKSLRDLGEMHNISHEGVRQLFVEHKLPTERPRPQTLRRLATEVEAWTHKDEIWTLYQDLGSVARVAKKTKLPHHQVADVVNQMPLREIYRRKGEPSSYPKDKIIAALREAAKTCGEPLTIACYRKAAGPTRNEAGEIVNPGPGWPADLTITRAFGSWQAACEAAGVKYNPPKGPQKGATTADECIIAVRLCASEIGKVPSYAAYSKWARENRQPSGPTVRVKVGPWRQALKEAFGD